MRRKNTYSTKRISKRQLLVDIAARLGNKIPHIHSIWEMDVYPIRKELKEFNKKNNCSVSLYTYLLYCYVKTIEKNLDFQAIHGVGRRKRIYQSVDVFFPIELPNNELRLHIIRACESKSLLEIQKEIEHQVSRVPKSLPWNIQLYLAFPKFLRNWISDIGFAVPSARKYLYGTAYFTAMKTVANVKGVGIPLPLNSVGMLVGHVENGNKNNILSITNSVDHRLVNGNQLVRFCGELKKNTENLIKTF
jgi:pyruvate/2-oxoglutarate dehydrogenase complex dihydrolipoamide acyltransferase (E2) component